MSSFISDSGIYKFVDGLLEILGVKVNGKEPGAMAQSNGRRSGCSC